MARSRWTCAVGLRSSAAMSSNDVLVDLVGIGTQGSTGAVLPVKNPNSGDRAHSGMVGSDWGAIVTTTGLPDSSLSLTSPFSSLLISCLLMSSPAATFGRLAAEGCSPNEISMGVSSLRFAVSSANVGIAVLDIGGNGVCVGGLVPTKSGGGDLWFCKMAGGAFAIGV